MKADGEATRSEILVGNLEPATEVLHALIGSVTDDPKQDLLASIFAFAVEKARPPTPPPPSPPVKKLRKAWTQAERQQKWEDGKAEAQIRLSTGRPTRASQSIVNAFVEEAGSAGPSTAHATPASPLGRSDRRSNRGSRVPPITPSDSIGRPKVQVGVVGVETIATVSDRERREMERQMDISVKEVDKKEQLLRFNIGWVLPEGSKRRRSDRPEPGSIRKGQSDRSVVFRQADISGVVHPQSSPSTVTPASPFKRNPSRLHIESSLTPAPEDEIIVSPDSQPDIVKTKQSRTPLFTGRYKGGRKRKAAEAAATAEDDRVHKKAKRGRPTEDVVLSTPISTPRSRSGGNRKANDDGEASSTPALQSQLVQPDSMLEEEKGEGVLTVGEDAFPAGTLGPYDFYAYICLAYASTLV